MPKGEGRKGKNSRGGSQRVGLTKFRLKPHEKKCADAFLAGHTMGESAILAGSKAASLTNASVTGSVILSRENVKAYLEEKSSVCAENVFALANNAQSEAVKLNANKDILDRGGFKPVNKVESVRVNVEISDKDFEEIMKNYSNKNDQRRTNFRRTKEALGTEEA
jgi:phage terminase small subunit